jgi:uncharacterized protein YdaU (DUF1376 family)
MNFYKHFLGDYARDTKGLSLLEHGAYRLLLDHVYATEQMLPNDLAEVCRIAGAMNAAERRAVEKVTERFFAINGDGRRHNKRAEEELGKHRQQVEHNRTVGTLGGRPRKKPGDNPSGFVEETRKEPGDNPSHSQKPERTTTSDASHRKPAAAPQTIPDCPQVLLVALYHEALPTLPRMLEWNNQRQAYARGRWREKAVSEPYATVEDGLAYWRGFFAWVAKSDFLMGRVQARGERKPFLADLEWLLKPTNFAKVIEGKYHS